MQIVALMNILDNDINNKIAKFIGVKQRPIINDLNYYISKFNFKYKDPNLTFDKYMFDILHCCSCNCLINGEMLRIHNIMCAECEAKLP